MKARFFNLLPFAAALALAALPGCATKPAAPVAKTYTFFPSAPEEPRLQFLTAYSSEQDLGRESTFADFITGEKPVINPIIKPYGLAIHAGKLFVCDTFGINIHIFDLQKQRVSYFAPRGEGKLRKPINLAIDADGTRYVADTGRKQVVIFDADGNYLAAIGLKDEMKPADVAVSSARFYVADNENHTVHVFDKATRKQLFSIPVHPESADEKLFSPINLAVDEPHNRLLVSDIGGCFVKIFDLDGKHLRTIGARGVGAGKFARPKGVAVDRDGLTYVVDAATQVVQIFDTEGRLLLFFGEPEATTQGDLRLPASVKIDYENVGYFQKFAAPGQQIDYLVLVTSQVGDRKVNVYGFLKKTPTAP